MGRTWCRAFVPATNDLEAAVAPGNPGLTGTLAAMRFAGATDVAMTGSGSAVYGIFAGEGNAIRALRRLTGSSHGSRAWLVRTVGAAEYAAKLLRSEHGHTSV